MGRQRTASCVHAGVIAAAALKCMGGTMQGRLWPRSDEERKKAEEAGYDISRVSTSTMNSQSQCSLSGQQQFSEHAAPGLHALPAAPPKLRSPGFYILQKVVSWSGSCSAESPIAQAMFLVQAAVQSSKALAVLDNSAVVICRSCTQMICALGSKSSLQPLVCQTGIC